MQRRTLPWADWVAASGLAQASDTQLLYRYARLGEQAAFTVLVKRHGSLVYGVCRRLLRSEQDAEDALQATFLVLARKAASLHQPAALVSWLYGVAYRTARQLRSRQRVGQALETVAEPTTHPVDELAWQECGAAIDEAILQLPTKLRTVFLLCEVEELTTLSASRRLGIPEGTVVSRLHRARQQLQRLLSHRGITSTAGSLAALGAVSLPEALAHSTVHSISTACTTAVVTGLAQGVLSIMLWTKIATATVVTVTLGLVGVGSASLLGAAPGPKAQAFVATLPMDDKDQQIEQLRKQLAEARDREMAIRQKVEQLIKQQEATQRFLQQSMTGDIEAKNKANAQQSEAMKAKMQVEQAIQAEMQAREDQERALQNEKVTKEKQMHEKEYRMRLKAERRQLFELAKAKLSTEITNIQGQIEDLEQQTMIQKHVEVQLREQIAALQTMETKRIEMETKRIEAGTIGFEKKEDAAMNQIMRAIEKQQQVVKEFVSQLHKYRTLTTTVTRYKAQLALREKLLLEVEEKLLRQQFRLDD